MRSCRRWRSRGSRSSRWPAPTGCLRATRSSVSQLVAVEEEGDRLSVDEIVCTDTVYAPHAIKGLRKLRIESVAPVIGEAIRCNHEGRSVGELFVFWTEDMPPESWFG